MYLKPRTHSCLCPFPEIPEILKCTLRMETAGRASFGHGLPIWCSSLGKDQFPSHWALESLPGDCLSTHLPSGPRDPGWEQTVPLKSNHFVSDNQSFRLMTFLFACQRQHGSSKAGVVPLLSDQALELLRFICAFPLCISWQEIVCTPCERDFEYLWQTVSNPKKTEVIYGFAVKCSGPRGDYFQGFIHSLIKWFLEGTVTFFHASQDLEACCVQAGRSSVCRVIDESGLKKTGEPERDGVESPGNDFLAIQ